MTKIGFVERRSGYLTNAYLSPSHLMLVLTCFIGLANEPLVAQGKEQTSESIFARSKSAVVQVLAGGRTGTGFIIAPNGTILTAHHLVASLQVVGNHVEVNYSPSILVKFSDGRWVAADPLRPSSDLESAVHDYALLKTRETGLPYLRLGSWKDVTEGDDLTVLGYALNSPSPLLTKAIVSGRYAIPSRLKVGESPIAKNAIIFQGPANPGFSGGPAISNKTGRVVGIVTDRLVGLGPELEKAREQITSSRRQGSVEIMGVNPNEAILALINVLDAYLSNGMGAAVAVDYAKEASVSLLPGPLPPRKH